MVVAVDYAFIPSGSVVEPALGYVYLDVGNSLQPGVLDHHQPDAPPECSAGLVQNYPSYVTRQVSSGSIVVVTHHQPDLDACTAVYLSERLARDEPWQTGVGAWIDIVRDIDRGRTAVDPVTTNGVQFVRGTPQ
jgi:hypothetical protein